MSSRVILARKDTFCSYYSKKEKKAHLNSILQEPMKKNKKNKPITYKNNIKITTKNQFN